MRSIGQEVIVDGSICKILQNLGGGDYVVRGHKGRYAVNERAMKDMPKITEPAVLSEDEAEDGNVIDMIKSLMGVDFQDKFVALDGDSRISLVTNHLGIEMSDEEDNIVRTYAEDKKE